MSNVTEMTINNKTYVIAEVGYDLLDHLNMNDLSIEDLNNKNRRISMVTVFVSYVMHCSRDAANREITQHIINGGNLGELVEAMMKALENSRFFTAMMRTAEAEETAETV